MSDRYDGSAEIEVTADGARFVRELAALIDAAERRRVGINVEADDAGEVTAAINAAVRAADTEVDVEVDADPVQVRRAIEAAARIANPEVDVEVEVEFRRDVNGRLRDAFGRFVTEGRRSGSQTGEAFTEGLEAALSSATGIRLPVVGFAVLGAAAAAAAAQLVQFAAAVAPAVGIAATLPAVLTGAAGAVSVFRVALVGVGDAFEAAVSGDGEEFAESLENIAPNAAAAAEALRDITPVFSALREEVQNNLFDGFDQLFQDIADTLGGPLTEGMAAAAEAINGIALAIGDVILSTSGVSVIESTFDGIVNAAANLEQPIADLIAGFLQVGDAINRAFGGEDALTNISDAIQGFADFLSEAAASGDAVRWVENALDVFDQLGQILSPIIGIFGSIGEAASRTGGNILGLWGAAFQAFDDFLASADGMDFLINLFETFNAVGSLLGDVLAALGPAFIPIVEAISLAVQAVSPFIVAIAQLASIIIQAVMPAVVGLLSVIAPIAEGFGQLAVQSLQAFMDVLLPLVGVAYELIQALDPLWKVLQTQLFPAFGELTEAIAGPFIEAVAQIVPLLVEALVPAVTELALAFVPLIVEVAQLASDFAAVLGPAVAEFVSTVLVPFIISTLPAIVAGIQLVIGWITQWVSGIITIIGWIRQLIDYWADLIDEIRNSAFVEELGNILSAGERFRDGMIDFVNDIVEAFLNLGSTVAGVWDNVSGIVSNIQGALNGIDIPSIPFSFNATGASGTGGESGGASSTTVNQNVTVNAAAADPWLVGGAVARAVTRASLGGAVWGTS